MKFDEVDIRILSNLMENSRLSYRQIGKKINVSVATVMNRIKKLENNGVIRKYNCSVDFSKLGFNVTAIIEIKIDKGVEKEDLKIYEDLKRIPYITALYSVTGQFDVIAIAKFRDNKELNYFIEELSKNKSLEETNTKYVLDIIKEENTIKIDHPILNFK